MRKTLIFFLMTLFSAPLFAKVYKCTDENGKVFYHDNPKKLERICKKETQEFKTRTRSIRSEHGCVGKSLKQLENSPNKEVVAEVSNNGAVVRLQQDRAGSYVAGGKINGQNVAFLVDTGASSIAIPSRVAECLRLKKGTLSKASTANGMTKVYSTELDSIILGAIEMAGIQAFITPNQKDDLILLGMNFLKHLEMSQKNNQLILNYKPPR